MLPNPFGPVVERHRGWQMIERVLADQADQVFGGIELGGISRDMEETHGHSLGQGDLRQQFGQGLFHVVAMDAGVVEDEQDLAEALLGVAQDEQGEDEYGVPGLGLGLEIDGGLAAAQFHRQEAVQLPAPTFVAGRGGRGVFLGPGVMGVGGGFQGELVEGNEGGVLGRRTDFFSSVLTNSARCRGRAGP
jgi:hypothetical protein